MRQFGGADLLTLLHRLNGLANGRRHPLGGDGVEDRLQEIAGEGEVVDDQNHVLVIEGEAFQGVGRVAPSRRRREAVERGPEEGITNAASSNFSTPVGPTRKPARSAYSIAFSTARKAMPSSGAVIRSGATSRAASDRRTASAAHRRPAGPAARRRPARPDGHRRRGPGRPRRWRHPRAGRPSRARRAGASPDGCTPGGGSGPGTVAGSPPAGGP